MERLKTAAIVALLLALAGSIALAASGGTAEVRINARQLADGRVEFALQQRTDGEWGDRQLPRSRYFPADATVGRWLRSSPINIAVSTPAAATVRRGGTNVIEISGTGNYANRIDTSQPNYLCKFEVTGTLYEGEYVSGAGLNVQLGGDTIVNQWNIDGESEDGTYEALVTPNEYSQRYGTVEVEISSGVPAKWTLICN